MDSLLKAKCEGERIGLGWVLYLFEHNPDQVKDLVQRRYDNFNTLLAESEALTDAKYKHALQEGELKGLNAAIPLIGIISSLWERPATASEGFYLLSNAAKIMERISELEKGITCTSQENT